MVGTIWVKQIKLVLSHPHSNINSPISAGRKCTPSLQKYRVKSWTDKRIGIFMEKIIVSPKIYLICQCLCFPKVLIIWNFLWHFFLPLRCPHGFQTAHSLWYQISLLGANYEQWDNTKGTCSDSFSMQIFCGTNVFMGENWKFFSSMNSPLVNFELGNPRTNGVVSWLEQSQQKWGKICFQYWAGSSTRRMKHFRFLYVTKLNVTLYCFG